MGVEEFLAIPEAALSEPLHPDIYVEPKDRNLASEDRRQTALVNAVKRDDPHIAVHATPNGGRQSNWMRLNGWKLGAYAGWPDLSFDWQGGGAHVEMKDGDGNPSIEQISCLNRLHRIGKSVAICRTKEGAINWLLSIGAPISLGREL